MPERRNGIPRAWWTELAPEMVRVERAWLRAEVYGAFRPACDTGPVACDVALRRVTARERWRADPADCPAPGAR